MGVAKTSFGCSEKDSQSRLNYLDLIGRYI